MFAGGFVGFLLTTVIIVVLCEIAGCLAFPQLDLSPYLLHMCETCEKSGDCKKEISGAHSPSVAAYRSVVFG